MTSNSTQPTVAHATPPARSAAADAAIELSSITKVFGGMFRGRVRALDNASMVVRRGEIFGLLGPNGAGKSTLVKILMTVVRPTACDGTLLGRPVGDKSALVRVGYLPEHHAFPGYLSGFEVLDFFGGLAKVPRRDRHRRAGELLDLVGMTAWADRPVRSYSKGMRQRVGVAQSLMNDPDLVLLDEPTDGVDPVGRRDIREVLRRLRDRGKTVLVNSHLLGELEQVCDRVAILVKGRLARQGTLDELTTGRLAYEVELDAPPDPAADPLRRCITADAGPAAADGVSRGRLATGEAVTISGAVLRVATGDAAAVQPVIDAARAMGATVRAVRPIRPSLEDLFIQAVTDPETGRTLTPGADSERRGGRGGSRP